MPPAEPAAGQRQSAGRAANRTTRDGCGGITARFLVGLSVRGPPIRSPKPPNHRRSLDPTPCLTGTGIAYTNLTSESIANGHCVPSEIPPQPPAVPPHSSGSSSSLSPRPPPPEAGVYLQARSDSSNVRCTRSQVTISDGEGSARMRRVRHHALHILLVDAFRVGMVQLALDACPHAPAS